MAKPIATIYLIAASMLDQLTKRSTFVFSAEQHTFFIFLIILSMLKIPQDNAKSDLA